MYQAQTFQAYSWLTFFFIFQTLHDFSHFTFFSSLSTDPSTQTKNSKHEKLKQKLSKLDYARHLLTFFI